VSRIVYGSRWTAPSPLEVDILFRLLRQARNPRDPRPMGSEPRLDDLRAWVKSAPGKHRLRLLPTADADVLRVTLAGRHVCRFRKESPNPYGV
jgi:hypothetical protein